MTTNRFFDQPILRVREGRGERCMDQVTLEEPLAIQMASGPEASRQWRTIAVTMRTPGHDRELAAGFLVGEGLLRSLAQIEAVYTLGARDPRHGWQHEVRVTLRAGVEPDFDRLQRNFYTTSSCGICGKTSIEALEMNHFPILPAPSWQIRANIVSSLPARLREAQQIFDKTGGLHAAGLFTPAGEPILIREDVGRHNAVDKVIGAQFLTGHSPLSDAVLVVSGRASFELMQKAIAAGIPMLVAVGAPSSLAIEVAEKFGATLIGFTKATGFNFYSGAGRVSGIRESNDAQLPRRILEEMMS